MKKLHSILLIGLLTSINLVEAQTLNTVSGDQKINGGTGTTTVRPNLKVEGTGGVVFGGTQNLGSIPVTGAGTRMMWYPKKSAFRAGRVIGNEWDDFNIGIGSFATGLANVAKGELSVAMGLNSFALGFASIAIGSDSWANGEYSFALGNRTSAGGESSTAIGCFVGARSYQSIVLGVGNFTGTYSDWSVPQSSTTWIDTDELLVVGNGRADWSESNALVLRKNANLRIGGKFEAKGVVRCAAGGDISMGSFTAGHNPADLNEALTYNYDE